MKYVFKTSNNPRIIYIYNLITLEFNHVVFNNHYYYAIINVFKSMVLLILNKSMKTHNDKYLIDKIVLMD